MNNNETDTLRDVMYVQNHRVDNELLAMLDQTTLTRQTKVGVDDSSVMLHQRPVPVFDTASAAHQIRPATTYQAYLTCLLAPQRGSLLTSECALDPAQF